MSQAPAPAPAPTEDAPPQPLSEREIRDLIATVQKTTADELAALRGKTAALEQLDRARIAAATRDLKKGYDEAIETHARANRDLAGTNAALQARAKKAEAALADERAKAAAGVPVATAGLTAGDIAALKDLAARSIAAKSSPSVEASTAPAAAPASV